MLHALIIDDHASTLTALADLVRQEGFEVDCAGDLAGARRLLGERQPDVVLCDLVLPDGKGTELLIDLQERSDIDVILVTGRASVESAVESLRLGAYDYLTKPVDHGRLKALLASVGRTRNLKMTITGLRAQLRQLGRFGPLIGTSARMQRVYDLIEKVAPTDATVFLAGESGTGKELAARTIHQLSRRSAEAFVALNCGAISPNLIESHLFGHEKGSFTGAVKRRIGYFEQADGGTLLLDEITEMPLDLQVKLLRVLETRTFRRVGDTEELPVDVRLIAATNRDPERAVAEKHLREDLLYRLKVFPIEMPPLRARLDDLEILSLYTVAELNRETGERKGLSAAALEKLRLHTWPGNVREMKNVLKRAYILAETQIEPEHLPQEVLESGGMRGEELLLRVGMSVADAERQLVLATLEQCEGNKRQAAQILGVSLKTLYNRLHSYAEDHARRSGGE